MATKEKSCKLCDSKRFANTSWCTKHYREREKEKADKKLARKKTTKKYQKSEKKKWHRKTWKLMSEWVRRKNAGWGGYNKCYTCDKSALWKELHAGHFQHGKLDFDERNLKPQCPACNTYRGGMLDVYTMNLIQQYGKGWVAWLMNDAAKHEGYSVEEMQKIHAVLKEKLSTLQG